MSARTYKAKSDTVYRATIERFNAQDTVWHREVFGPYATAGAARARITRETMHGNLAGIRGYVEESPTTWSAL